MPQIAFLDPGEIDNFDIGPYTLMENQTFNVTCDFQGNPAPTWLIGNRDNGHTLIIVNLPAEATVGPVVVSCEDSGFWECTGQNRLNNGVNATQGHYITVNCKLSVNTIKKTKLKNVIKMKVR